MTYVPHSLSRWHWSGVSLDVDERAGEGCSNAANFQRCRGHPSVLRPVKAPQQVGSYGSPVDAAWPMLDMYYICNFCSHFRSSERMYHLYTLTYIQRRLAWPLRKDDTNSFKGTTQVFLQSFLSHRMARWPGLELSIAGGTWLTVVRGCVRLTGLGCMSPTSL